MTRIPQTRRKLREAEFFLSFLSGRQDSEEFGFYLSAFLSASRSITFVLQAEQKDAYSDWFPEWEKTLDTDGQKLLKFMNSRRVAEVHKKGTKLLAKVELTPVSKVQMRRLEHPSYGFHWFDPSVPPSSDSLYIELEGKLYYCDLGETAYSVVIDGTIEEVVDACSRYLGILQKLLEDFEGSLC